MVNYNLIIDDGISKGKDTVQVRGGFSDRYGIKTENRDIQFTSLDQRSRRAMANLISQYWAKYFDTNKCYLLDSREAKILK